MSLLHTGFYTALLKKHVKAGTETETEQHCLILQVYECSPVVNYF